MATLTEHQIIIKETSFVEVTVTNTREICLLICSRIVKNIDNRLLRSFIRTNEQLKDFQQLCVQLYGLKQICFKFLGQIEGMIVTYSEWDMLLRPKIEINEIKLETKNIATLLDNEYVFDLSDESLNRVPLDALVMFLNRVIESSFKKLQSCVKDGYKYLTAGEMISNIKCMGIILVTIIKTMQGHPSNYLTNQDPIVRVSIID